MRILKRALTVATMLGGTALIAGPAGAAVLPPEYAGLELGARLSVIQSHQSTAEQLATADAACAVLRADPTVTGKREALELVRGAGYTDAFATGWALGSMAEVRCADLRWVLTHAL